MTTPSGRRVIAAVALVVAAATIAVALTHHADHPRARLVWSPSDGGFSVSLPYPGNERPWSFGSVPLCTDRAGRVTIDRVVPVGDNGGLRVVAIAVRPHVGRPAGVADTSFGNSQRDLAAEGFTTTQPPVVTVTCPADPHAAYPGRVIYDELGVQVQRTGPNDGIWTALRLDYTVDGHREQLTVPWSLRLCGPAGRTAATCPAAPEPKP